MVAKANHDALADSIISLVWRILRRHDAPVAKVYTGFWKNANPGDASLSDVILTSGEPVTGCPKIGSPSFSVNSPVLLIKGPGVPWTILGVFQGDITQAV
jgi:hypothetical protein